MDRVQELDDYVRLRTRAAGGALVRDRPLDASLADLRRIYLAPLEALKAARADANGRFVSFANYDYLDLGNDQRVRRAACDAIMTLGVGAGASRLVGGERTIHGALERDIAAFLGLDDALVLVSGYMANASLVGHLLTRNDLLIVDELAHNSIVVGSQASHASVARFSHGDLDALEAVLERRRRGTKRALIVVEGLYSMDGDVPDLPRLLAIRDRYDAWLMVDEAHSIGVLGATGRGITEHFGVDPRAIDFTVGTLSKAFAGCGGFIAGRRPVIDWLRFTLPAFVFSVGMPPVIAAAVRAGITILRQEPWRVTRLQSNSQTFLRQARARGFDTGVAVGAGVVPILFATQAQCMRAARILLQAGYYAPPIPHLAVPRNKPRIRHFITAAHTPADIAGALDALAAAGGRATGLARAVPRSAEMQSPASFI